MRLDEFARKKKEKSVYDPVKAALDGEEKRRRINLL